MNRVKMTASKYSFLSLDKTGETDDDVSKRECEKKIKYPGKGIELCQKITTTTCTSMKNKQTQQNDDSANLVHFFYLPLLP